MGGTRRNWRMRAVVAGLTAAAVLHLAAPAGPHGWHWLHLVAQKLYYVPILMAAGWFGTRAALAATCAATLLSLAHVLRDWAGRPMVQAEELAGIASFWVIAGVSASLFGRERRALDQVRLAHEETLRALASSLELRERYTGGHSQRVRDYALLLAAELGLRDPAFLTSLAQGALLHDVGKIGIPDGILLKEGPLAEAEQAVMRRHPDLGASLVGEIASLRETRELIRAHHERYDGTGYPRGLSGAVIPLPARIFAVGDAFDALTTDRPYHDAVSWEEAARVIADGRGSQFDPEVVDAFLRVPFEDWSWAAVGAGVALRRSPLDEDRADRPAARGDRGVEGRKVEP